MEPEHRRIGVFGGTFDPPHFGHLAIAEEARIALSLERVLIAPAGRPPHKPDRPVTSALHRVAMLERAIAGNPGFEITRADLDRPGPSYTAGLLEELHHTLGPECDLYFIMGLDCLRDFLGWRTPGRIVDLARLIAVGRPGITADLAEVERSLPQAAGRVIVLNGPGLEIASSDLQQRVRDGLPIRYQTPDGVVAYIEEQKLYAPEVRTVADTLRDHAISTVHALPCGGSQGGVRGEAV